MNKALKSLVLATMIVGTINADSDTNKTFMNPRSHGTNLEYWYGAGIQEVINRKDKDKFGGTFFATGFYTDGEMAGEYWTPANQNGFLLNTLSADANGYFNFDTTDKATFDPKQEAYGVTLAYDQRLDSILKGLYFNVQLPIVHVKNDLGLSLEGTNKAAMATFLAGKMTTANRWINTSTAFRKVDALSNARIEGDDETTGIADIDLRLGYNFLNKKTYRVGLNLGFTIPTGKDSEAIVANEAIVGNGQHFGLGGGLSFDARIWGTSEHNFIVYGDLQYKYLFEASGKRTLGLKATSGEYLWGQYLPLTTASNETVVTSVDVVPGANVLTQNIDITPGSQFDGIVALAYNNGGFSANLGYNLYFREEEDVELKDKNALDTLPVYNVITGVTGTTSVIIAATALDKTNLDLNPAETKSQVSHKVFGGLAWTFKNWETPVNVGVGGHYEFMEDREGYENWGINARLGIGF